MDICQDIPSSFTFNMGNIDQHLRMRTQRLLTHDLCQRVFLVLSHFFVPTDYVLYDCIISFDVNTSCTIAIINE